MHDITTPFAQDNLYKKNSTETDVENSYCVYSLLWEITKESLLIPHNLSQHVKMNEN